MCNQACVRLRENPPQFFLSMDGGHSQFENPVLLLAKVRFVILPHTASLTRPSHIHDRHCLQHHTKAVTDSHVSSI